MYCARRLSGRLTRLPIAMAFLVIDLQQISAALSTSRYSSPTPYLAITNPVTWSREPEYSDPHSGSFRHRLRCVVRMTSTHLCIRASPQIPVLRLQVPI